MSGTCPNCGSPHEPKAGYCAKCGAWLGSDQPQQNSTEETSLADGSNKTKYLDETRTKAILNSKPKKRIIALLLALLLGLLGGHNFYMGHYLWAPVKPILLFVGIGNEYWWFVVVAMLLLVTEVIGLLAGWIKSAGGREMTWI